jgi:hypothetical protein
MRFTHQFGWFRASAVWTQKTAGLTAETQGMHDLGLRCHQRNNCPHKIGCVPFVGWVRCSACGRSSSNTLSSASGIYCLPKHPDRGPRMRFSHRELLQIRLRRPFAKPFKGYVPTCRRPLNCRQRHPCEPHCVVSAKLPWLFGRQQVFPRRGRSEKIRPLHGLTPVVSF